VALTALFTGVSGLAANSTALDVVGHNLANMNTTGYKNQRVLFKDQVYQLIDFGSSGTGSGVGGTNASQIGYGVGIGQVDTQFIQGAINPTGRDLDAAIQGGGFFVLRTATGMSYTRAGAFGVDATGYLVDPSTGARVQRTGTVGEPSATSIGFQAAGNNDIRVPIGAGAPGLPTANVMYQGNLNKNMAVGDTAVTGIQVFDTQSGPQNLTVVFTKTAVNTYTVSASIPGATVTAPPTPITFDTSGLLVSPTSLPLTVTGIPGATSQTINLQLGTPGTANGISQFGGESSVGAITQDGLGAGVLVNALIDNSGFVQGKFSNGRTIPLATIALASFNNEGGLIHEGQNYYSTGPASGEPLIGASGTGGRGLVQGSKLEGSTVDIAIEFSRLIIAQRGFQVNTRTISAANETLQELASIIR
jgi:flagellar hook protein FlgE